MQGPSLPRALAPHPPLFPGHNEFITEVGSQLTFLLSAHIVAFRLGHVTGPVCALFIHPPLLVPRPPLFDELHLHSVLSAHSHSHTLDQCFSDFSWLSYSNSDSDSGRFEAWGTKNPHFYNYPGDADVATNHPLSSKTLDFIITWNCSTFPVLENILLTTVSYFLLPSVYRTSSLNANFHPP